MRKLAVILFLFSAGSCRDDDDPQKFSSLVGYWVVRTPDAATTLTFRIGIDPDTDQLAIENASVRHDGVDYNSGPVDAALVVTSESEVESMTFRATQFTIRLWTLTANADFTEMEIANSSFVIDQAFREFSMITATRK